ncbi:ABC transporter substrate-binding protein [Aeromonas schubertii]|uniref:Transporter binding protein n=1 Tax=Aeromonas schubertii TaxID=652 RepID=A0A0S2SKP6_9GAMM|nr:ABC transporter substrate-binding protein [Aeromonas schubertii]ALP42296.1 transporter binding protein [Aeromonas schubertii]
MSQRRRLLQLEHKLGPLGEGEITLDELAQTFSCSRRNIQLVLGSLIEAGWIRWSPGRGRGHRSRIALLQSHHRLTMQEAEAACQRGQLDLAMALLEEIGARADFGQLLGQMVQRRRCVDGIIIPMVCPILELDPARTSSSSALHIIEHLYDGLLEVSPIDGALQPALAHHWEAREEGLCWHFWLRSGVRFHHGPTLEAGDVVRTLERLRDPASLFYSLYMHIVEVRALSPLKVEVRLAHPDPFLLQLLANPHSRIIAGEGRHDTVGRFTPFGTGPFQLHQRSEHHLILHRHEHHWGLLPQLEQIEIWHLLPSGRQPNLWLHTNPSQHPQGDAVNQIHETAGCFYLIFHHLSPLWQTEARRQALWHYLEQARHHADEMVPANSIFPGGHMLPPLCPEPPTWTPLGRPLRIAAPDNERCRRQRRWLAQSLERLGIECDWLPLPESGSEMGELDGADLVLLAEVLDSEGEWGLFELLISSSGISLALGQGAHRQMVATLRSHLARCRPQERLALFLQQEARLCSQYRYLPLFRQQEHVIFDPRLRGIQVNHQGYCSFRHLWLDEPELGVNICAPQEDPGSGGRL